MGLAPRPASHLRIRARRGGLAARASAPPVASPPPTAARDSTPELEAWPSTSPGDTAWGEPEVDAERVAAGPPSLVAGIRVEQTFWHPRPDRRVAVLALPEREQPLRVHEGDAVGALVVTEIEPSGVVFTQHGQRLRRALGEAP